ncbi:helicase associated domain-containing protein [Pseudarthrobacter sp. H3Y2-7]|uniref:helicase associated domain-containing protein n=1 Tax=Pseudarthrobacter naphthalenicus TaxID=3031328 RepID=UPI0023B1D816|nr:helicase associated domain-containing protein [Pseudarthrobacter sp. H3Y2-7]MDE8670577.1 helicase associated domain-containing protein [Pseudarthrobacter sp. H3Y2-7]
MGAPPPAGRRRRHEPWARGCIAVGRTPPQAPSPPPTGKRVSVIPGLEVVANQKADNEAHWDRRIAELVEYRSAGNYWPAIQGFATEEERVLGVWLHVQRISARDGTLTKVRESTLNKLLPGWRNCRSQRGNRRCV